MKPEYKFISSVLLLLIPGLLLLFGQGENLLAFAIFTVVVIFWLTELLPLPVTGLLVPLLVATYQVLPAEEAFQDFGNQILFLFLGCFLLAQAMQKHGLDKRIAYYLLSSRFASRSAERFCFFLALMCWAMSMWISNTATCAVFAPLCLGLVRVFGENTSDREHSQAFTYRLLLTCSFASSIGGIATPIGSPPNLIAIEFLSRIGIELSFLDWAIVGLPLSLVMLVLLHLLLSLRYPLKELRVSEAREHFCQLFSSLGSLTSAEKRVAVVFCCAVVFWIAPGLLKEVLPGHAISIFFQQAVTMSVVGLAAGVSLFFIPHGLNKTAPILIWSDAKQVDWGTLLLFGGGLSLGRMLSHTGLAGLLGEFAISASGGSFLLLGALTIITALLMSEFASNTASAAVVIPIILAGASLEHAPQISTLAMACAFAASYGFMLPVSTPPNAIVYGTGELPAKEMRSAGILFDLLGALAIYVFVVLF